MRQRSHRSSLVLPLLILVSMPVLDARQGRAVTVSGTLTFRWIEDFSSPALFQYLLQTGTGAEIPLAFPTDSPALSLARQATARTPTNISVTIVGEQRADGSVEVQSMWSDFAMPAEGVAGAIAGPQPFVTILCRFSDSATFEPHPRDVYVPLLDAAYPHLDHYWRTASHGVMSLAGSATASAWVTLPLPRASYIVSETDSTENLYGQLAQDCARAADPLVSFPSYVGINMFFNRSLGCCSVGGSALITADGETRLYSVTWMHPDHRALPVVAHEIGHTFGFPHSSGPYSAIYDSAWDVMSQPGGVCRVADPALSCAPQHTIAFHKDLAGWIPPGRKFIAPARASTTITLDDHAASAGGGYLLAVVPLSSTASQFYTIEVRRTSSEYDVNVPADGVVIHLVDPTSMGYGDLNTPAARVTDSDGNGNPDDDGAIWSVGERFVDLANQITIAVVDTTTTSATVVIATYRPFADDPLTTGVSRVRAVHVTELRSRIDELRARFALAPFPWTDTTLAGAFIRTIHVAELRQALEAVYERAGRTAPAYSDPALISGVTPIRAAHIAELRAAVVTVE